MANHNYSLTEFKVTGTLVEILIKKDNQVKYLKLVTEQQEYRLKVAKEIRANLAQIVSLGANLIVEGIKKQNLKTGKVKFKANRVELVSSREDHKGKIVISDFSPRYHQPEPVKSKAKVLVCKKSSCWKRGGKAVCQAIETLCRDRGLEEHIQVKTTGCLKQCKKGPNLVMMPDKARYSQVKTKQIPALVEKHLLVNS